MNFLSEIVRFDSEEKQNSLGLYFLRLCDIFDDNPMISLNSITIFIFRADILLLIRD